MVMKDYYAIMGLPPNAPQAAVKARYRVLAQELHPDKPTGNEGAFKALQEAYECLGNVARRRAYDLEYKVRRFVSAPVTTGFDLVGALSGVARHYGVPAALVNQAVPVLERKLDDHGVKARAVTAEDALQAMGWLRPKRRKRA
jgi:curved DNA-binding protein CbpA